MKCIVEGIPQEEEICEYSACLCTGGVFLRRRVYRLTINDIKQQQKEIKHE
jgi:hypothetical protein